MSLNRLRGSILRNSKSKTRFGQSSGKARGGLCVPLFVYPGVKGLESWSRVASTISRYNLQDRSLVVINPDNGDFGMEPDKLASIKQGPHGISAKRINADFIRGCQLLQSNNIRTLGYVHTKYGGREIELVQNRIELYDRIYNTDGILLDEMAHEGGMEEYYSSLNSFVKDLGMSVTAGNPGTAVPESYLKTVDTLIVNEEDGYPNMDKVVQRTFNDKYPSEKFGLILHSLSSYDPAWVTQATKLAGYLYLTKGMLPNPYDPVTDYLELLARQLSGD